jgi:hypothetical protein
MKSFIMFVLILTATISIAQEKLVLQVIEYDKAAPVYFNGGADLIAVSRDARNPTYYRLIYAPVGFGFDAPPAKPGQLLPLMMFTDGSLLWLFTFHAPRIEEEKAACSAKFTQYTQDKDGKFIPINRYSKIPKSSHKDMPNKALMPCMIVDNFSLEK